jgi:hypothetical protein
MQAAVQQTALVELGKFLSLCSEGVKNLVMPSTFVDNVWHELHQNERAYNEFCHKHAGSYIEHLEDEGQGTVQWVNEYEERYGSLPSVWFMNEKGEIDNQAYNQYLKTGIWERASWRCRPKDPDKD